MPNAKLQRSFQPHGAGGLDVAPDVLEKAYQQIGVGVPTRALVKAGEVKEALALCAVEQPDQPPGHTAAEGAAYAADGHRGLPQRAAIEDQLRVEQYAGHHECRKIIVLHALLRKARRDGDRAVHAQRRGDAQQARGNHAQPAHFPLANFGKSAVDIPLAKHRHRAAQQYAQRPVGRDLPNLDVQIIPEIDRLAADPFNHSMTTRS